MLMGGSHKSHIIIKQNRRRRINENYIRVAAIMKFEFGSVEEN